MRIPVRIDQVFFVLAGTLLFWGCTNLRNEISPGLLGVESPKLVVTCFISPQDTTLVVKVTRSSTVVGDNIGLLETGSAVTNANVTLAQGNRSVTMRYDNRPVDSSSVQPYYSTSATLLPIVAGQTYTLTVVTPSGQRASSSCTVPTPVSPTTITFDSLDDIQNRAEVRRYFVKAQWKDPANQTNYYQVAGVLRYTVPAAAKEEKYNNLTFDDDNRGLFTDAGLDGTTFVSGRAFIAAPGSNFQQSSFINQYKTAVVLVNLMTINQAYYRFQEAIIRQRRSRNNPFAEPVLIPSNIEGGLGCFAGYNNTVLTETLK